MRLIPLIVLLSALGLAACSPASTASPASVATVVPSDVPAATDSGPAAGAPGKAGIFPQPGSTAGPFGGADVITYANDRLGFSIQFPRVWQTSDEMANPLVYVVPASVGTTLVDKTFEILTTDNATDCKETTYSSATGSTSPEKVTINGVDFTKESGSDVGAGNIRDWTSYSVMKRTTCINITFVLHSVAAGVYSTEPAPFDKAEESQMFDLMIGTFTFK